MAWKKQKGSGGGRGGKDLARTLQGGLSWGVGQKRRSSLQEISKPKREKVLPRGASMVPLCREMEKQKLKGNRWAGEAGVKTRIRNRKRFTEKRRNYNGRV